MDMKRGAGQGKTASIFAVQRNFERAAATYDRFADVQVEVAARLVEQLPAGYRPAAIIELGCGTGNLTSRLHHRYPAASLVAVDFSAAMISRAAARPQSRDVRFFCQDIEEFLASYRNCADLLVSNATLQWIERLEPVIASARQHLRKDGLLAFSVFGPESLAELQQALDAVLVGSGKLAAGRFKSASLIVRLLQRYFAIVEEDTMIIKREYPDVLSLLRQIRKTGTGGAHRAPLRMGRRHLAAMDAWFKERYGGCRASYQILFFRCRP